MLANGEGEGRRSSLNYSDLERNEFSSECVINDSYFNYLNLSVASTGF